MSRAKALRVVLTLFGVVLLLAPISVMLTFLLAPVWSWLERTTGIESIGHSGPAEWCYLLVFSVAVVAAGAIALTRRLRK